MDLPLPRPILYKIPGELPKQKPEQHIDDISKLTKVQLLEIKEREEKLLANKPWIARLPDKGKRIRDFYEKVLKELSHRNEVDRAAELFSDLNIATKGEKKLTNLEWTGRCETQNGEVVLDSDDDETDPLKIIAQSTNVEKKVIILPPEKSLVTEEDLKEIESFKTEISSTEVYIKQQSKSPNTSIELEPHVLYLFEKGVDDIPKTEKYKPHKTTKSDVHNPEKELLRKPKSKTWEVTAATPPSLSHPGTKVMSLQESVEIQAAYLDKLKKLQEIQAQERLKLKTERLKSLGIKPPEDSTKLNNFLSTYRDTLQDDSSDSSSEHENEHLDSDEGVRDEEEDRSGVTFVVYK